MKLNQAEFTEMGSLSRIPGLMFQFTHQIKALVAYLVGWLKNSSKVGLLVMTWRCLLKKGTSKTPGNLKTAVDLPSKTDLFTAEGPRMPFTILPLKLHLIFVFCVCQGMYIISLV